MGIAGGGQKGGRIESSGGGAMRGKSQRDKCAPRSLRVVRASSLGTRRTTSAVDWETGLPCQGWGAAMSASWLCEHRL